MKSFEEVDTKYENINDLLKSIGYKWDLYWLRSIQLIRYKLVSWLLREKIIGNDELTKFHHDLLVYMSMLEDENRRMRRALRLPYKMYYEYISVKDYKKYKNKLLKTINYLKT